MKVTDQQIRELIEKYQYGRGAGGHLVTTRQRAFYEDEWTEHVLNEPAAFNMMKELLELSQKE